MIPLWERYKEEPDENSDETEANNIATETFQKISSALQEALEKEGITEPVSYLNKTGGLKVKRTELFNGDLVLDYSIPVENRKKHKKILSVKYENVNDLTKIKVQINKV